MQVQLFATGKKQGVLVVYQTVESDYNPDTWFSPQIDENRLYERIIDYDDDFMQSYLSKLIPLAEKLKEAENESRYIDKTNA